MDKWINECRIYCYNRESMCYNIIYLSVQRILFHIYNYNIFYIITH